MDMSGSMVTTYPNSGDLYKKRDDALSAGFNYQIANFEQSKAGYIGFGTNLVTKVNYPSLPLLGDHLLAPVFVRTGQTDLNRMITYITDFVQTRDLSAGGTNYYAALDQAIKWIRDPAICPHKVKAIIFISDGKPESGPIINYPWGTLTNMLVQDSVKVHGIYVGRTNAPDLDSLANATGGSRWIVPQQNTDTLANVVKAIIKSYSEPFFSKGVTLYNNTTQDTVTGQMVKRDDTTWVVKMNNTLPLKSGVNQLRLNALFGTANPALDTTLALKFYIDVGGDTSYTNECFYCWPRTHMGVFVNNIAKDTLTFEDTNYTLRLFYYGEDSLKTVNVRMKTVTKGDSGTITMTNPSWNGKCWMFSKNLSFKIINGSPVLNDPITEADFEDKVTFHWRHPKEPIDTAFTSVIVKAPPTRMEIHNKAGTPTSASKYPTSPAFDTVTAGIDADLYAKVFANTKWLSDYESLPALYKKITWKLTDTNGVALNPTYGFLKLDSVAHNIFHPRRAYIFVDITATLTIAGLNPIPEKIRLYIQPGEATQLVIEASKTPPLPVVRTDYSPIMILGNQTTKTAYAILRDSLGNASIPFLATQAAWSSEATSIATVSPGPSEDGVIQKQGQGQTIIHAIQNGMEDTAVVICTPYTIDSIRIVRVHNYTDTADIKNLYMNTNQDTTLHVLGLTSDFKLWIPIDGDWSITDPAAVDPQPPKASKRWSFSPTRPDSGVIISSFDGTSGKLYDTVNYQFTPGAPIQVRFTIITPDDSLIAGRKIKGLVEIINKDGYVPGLWKYPGLGGPGGTDSADYTDILDAGLPGIKGYIPYGTTYDLSGALLGTDKFASKKMTVSQWFMNGMDTLDFVLYNTGSVVGSPAAKPHKLTVYLDALSASTKDFILKPGPLDTIVLNPDTIPTLNPNDPSFLITGTGYDEFGNYLPNEIFLWTNDTSLFDFFINSQSTQIFLDPSDATDDQEGWIYVNGISDTTVKNKVYIKIVGPKPKMITATTRDNNGNGFLDIIEILLDKPVKLPAGYVTDNVIVENGSVFIRADSLTIAPLSSDKKLLLHLSEIQSIITNKPQTAWTPLLTIIDCDSIGEIKRATCIDGAAPVVWTAVKDVKDVLDRKKDVVTIKLSETFKSLQGTAIVPFLTSTEPRSVINVWMGNTTVKVDSMLAKTSGPAGGEIKNFASQLDDWCVFKMTNGNDLNSQHFVNINDLNTVVCDLKGNVPHALNQKVRVKVTGNIGDIIVAPIPIIPTLIIHNQIINNPLIHYDSLNIFNIITNNGGAIITIPIKGQLKGLQASLMVFDAAANLVFSQQSIDNLLGSGPFSLPQWMKDALMNGTGIVNLNFYWSGCTSKGMKSAPGVYKLIVYIVAKKDDKGKIKTETRKYGKTVAVGR